MPFISWQASGSQVRLAASIVDATFETRVIATGGVPDYECEVLATNRDYDNDGEDSFGQGFFILELSVQQVVYVTTTGTPFSDDLVKDIVSTGFDRGGGGRVRFRALLRQKSQFVTVINVDVLDDGLSPPQSAPSFTPTRSPTENPTPRPSLTPTTGPSSPTTGEPTRQPSQRPSSFPPTIAPSLSVSPPLQTMTPTTGKDEEEPDRRSLIAGAIVGAVMTVLVTCFFIFCVWFPICGNKEEEDTNTSDDRQSKRCHVGPPVLRSPQESTIVPDIVQVIDSGDTDSLANTTLGDHTTSGVAPNGLPFPPPPPPPSQTRGLEGASEEYRTSAERFGSSFDDGSLYTSSAVGSNIEDTSLINQEPKTSRKAKSTPLHRPLEYEEDIFFPLSDSATESSNEAYSPGTNEKTNDGQLHGTEDEYLDDDDDLSFGSVRSSASSSSFVENVTSDEERAKQVSRSMNNGTKGFDPFADGDSTGSSSFGFETDADGPNMANIYTASDVEEQVSPSSHRTKQTDNLLSGSPIGDRRRHLVSPEEEKREVDNEIRDDPYSAAGADIPSPPRLKESAIVDKTKFNNSLLRAVLEDARKRSRTRPSSSRSRLSRKSAPSRISSRRKSLRNEDSHPHDIVDGRKDLEEFMAHSKGSSRKKIPMSSKSTGDLNLKPRDVSGQKKIKSVSPKPCDSSDGEPAKPSHEAQTAPPPPPPPPPVSKPPQTNPYRTRFLERPATAGPHHFLPPMVEKSAPRGLRNPKQYLGTKYSTSPDSSIPSSSNSTPTTEDGTGTLGAEPREETYKLAEESDSSLPPTPATSPGMLGIAMPPKEQKIDPNGSSDSEGMSNPWLFDVIEQTLGPRSPSADIESLSGRSNRSSKSHKSALSGRSLRSSPSNHSYISSPSEGSKTSDESLTSERRGETPEYGSHPSTAAPVIDGSLEEHKSASEDPIAPRALDYDLKRLEIQLKDAFPRSHSGRRDPSSLASRSTISSLRDSVVHQSRKKRIVVVVPPGKLGVVLADRHDGRGVTVSEVRPSSAMSGKLSPGDKLGE